MSELATSLHDAIRGENIEAVRNFLSQKVDVNAPDDRGVTPLTLAIQNGYEEIVRLLLVSGAQVNSEKSVYTPLHTAVYAGKKEIVGLLVKAGANVNAKIRDGNTPLHLEAHGIRTKALGWDDRRDIVNLLVSAGAGVNLKNMYGFTALHYAAEEGDIDVTKLLLECGASVGSRNTKNETPLHLAVSVNNISVTKCLLSEGADINAKDGRGQTVLHIVASNTRNDSHASLAEVLLKNGADGRVQDDEGKTPIKILVDRRQYDTKVFDLFLKYVGENGKVSEEDSEDLGEERWRRLEKRVEDVERENEVLKKRLTDLEESVKSLMFNGNDL